MEYNDANRSFIQCKNRFKQPLLFEGMIFDKICPTDIDAFTEYHNRFFIIMEVKGQGGALSYGQGTALQRVVDAIQEGNKEAVLFICRHYISDTTQPVYLKDTLVTEAYYRKQWYQLKPKKSSEVWEHAMQWAKQCEEAQNGRFFI